MEIKKFIASFIVGLMLLLPVSIGQQAEIEAENTESTKPLISSIFDAIRDFFLGAASKVKFMISGDDDSVNVNINGQVSFQENEPITGKFSGTKFNDLDGDGIMDDGEPGLGNWTIYIDANGNNILDSGEVSVITNADGSYEFDSLSPGNYSAKELQKEMWMQTTENHGVEVSAGSDTQDVDFGNFKLGEIHGMKFEDKNENGAKDDGEEGLPGWTINLTGPSNASTVTGADGAYSFTGLKAGMYTLAETLQAGWEQITPNHAVEIFSGSSVQDANFGNFRIEDTDIGQIHGMKFRDANNNGIKDDEEAGLANWVIYIDSNNNGIMDPDEKNTATAADGSYSFTELSAGNYTIREVQQSGWAQTTPSRVVEVASESVVEEVDFGNFHPDITEKLPEELPQDGEFQNNGATKSLISSIFDAIRDFFLGAASEIKFRISSDDNGNTEVDIKGKTSLQGQNENQNNADADSRKQRAKSAIDDAAKAIAECKAKIKQSGKHSSAVLLSNAEKRLAKAKEEFTEEKYGSAFGQANAAKHLASNACKIPAKKFSTISGVKFNDINGNGIKDANETGLANWTIYIDANGNNVFDINEAKTMTNSSGGYKFSVGPGNYTIREVQQSGWNQTTANPAKVEVKKGNAVGNVDFGNFKLGEIRGIKFNDLDADGVRDGNETGLANWTIFIDGNKNGVFDSGIEDRAITEEDGSYKFSGLGAGNYTIREVQQDGWNQTTANPAPIHIASGSNIANIDFGNFRPEEPSTGEITGMKFNDMNGNGARDSNETGLGNWTIYIDANGNNVFDINESSAVTDANGNYSFTNLIAGNYTIREVQQDGWNQTTANPAAITVTPKSSFTNVNFGNSKLAEELGGISGIKFNDLDADGVRDGNETGLANWTITIMGPVNMAKITDEEGKYSFTGLIAGNYTVSEETKPGWVQTKPNGNYTLEIAGSVTENIDFGNVLIVSNTTNTTS